MNNSHPQNFDLLEIQFDQKEVFVWKIYFLKVLCDLEMKSFQAKTI